MPNQRELPAAYSVSIHLVEGKLTMPSATVQNTSKEAHKMGKVLAYTAGYPMNSVVRVYPK